MEETCVLVIIETLTFGIYLLRTELIKMRYASNIVPHNICWHISSKILQGELFRKFR